MLSLHSRVRHSLTSSRRFLTLWQTNAWAEISAQLRCLVCQNQSIADSNAELAMDLKKQVVKQIAEGKTNQQIIDFMVDRYGDFVLYNPPFKMSTLLLWLGPILFLVLALGGLFYTMAKRRNLNPSN